ncbi:hypothetical protein N7491_002978 [Penicillium cf. griseofulvum]|uniref:Uncharacterized protein n=1 Tax=Penicillium cf. griseofulvum TaxID=2972120 RepID=A0A9W9T1W4_9EURO|nr:hypothetical protein N7472_002851 [Penicillium cf. griseofulvum]KAJ5440572.1 hypothetical protein N7491_002978 [Penicillium cf. griseofulvum]KAJ5448621.1 hypothetical protein N7445_003442 [Penicillium cf. griseofulvum]
MASQAGLTNKEATMNSGEPTSTRPKLAETSSSSHSPQCTDNPSSRIQVTEASPDKLLTTSRVGMPIHDITPVPQGTNRRRDAASDSSFVSAHSIPTITPDSTISSELHSYDLDNSSHCIDLDDFSVPPDAKVLTAPSFRQLKKALDQLKDQLSSPNPPSSQIIYLRDTGNELFSKIKNDQELFPGVRVTISYLRREVLFKVMPGHQHDSIIGVFSRALAVQLSHMGLSDENGAFVFRPSPRTKGRSVAKEPDWWLSPVDIFDGMGGGAGFPTLALEVGISEYYSQLRKDAQWWYSNSDHLTKCVVIICTTRNPTWRVDVEVWSEGPHPNPHETRNRVDTSLRPTQRVTYRDGRIHGAPLVLNFENIFRRPRNQHEGDIVIGMQCLEAMCQQVRS